MPAPNKIYFGQVASGVWADWVQVINVTNENAKLLAVARDANGRTIWSGEKTLGPFQGWTIPIEPISAQQELSLIVSSDKGIVGERHCHLGTEVLAFPGAAPELGTAGRRLFFPELSDACTDWFRVLNIDNQRALINVIVRDTYGNIFKQFSGQIDPLCFWSFADELVGKVSGSMEMLSTQMIVAERHLHYGEVIKGVAVGQLGQVLDISPFPTKLYFAQIAAGQWRDWVKIVNVSGEPARLISTAKDEEGNTVWSNERSVNPYQDWVVPVDPVAAQKDLSLTVSSNKHIVGERHCHLGTEVLPFPGAAPETRTAGRRLFFPELVAGSYDFFRILNITDQLAIVNAIVRDINGSVIKQLNGQIKPFGFWTIHDPDTVNVQGTMEIISTQIVVGERHLHYGGGAHAGSAVGQLGQVLD